MNKAKKYVSDEQRNTSNTERPILMLPFIFSNMTWGDLADPDIIREVALAVLALDKEYDR